MYKDEGTIVNDTNVTAEQILISLTWAVLSNCDETNITASEHLLHLRRRAYTRRFNPSHFDSLVNFSSTRNHLTPPFSHREVPPAPNGIIQPSVSCAFDGCWAKTTKCSHNAVAVAAWPSRHDFPLVQHRVTPSNIVRTHRILAES